MSARGYASERLGFADRSYIGMFIGDSLLNSMVDLRASADDSGTNVKLRFIDAAYAIVPCNGCCREICNLGIL